MKHTPISFAEKFSRFNDRWAPRVIAEVNDFQFKLVKLLGEFVWHYHEDTDEAFVVLNGSLEIQFRDGSVTLKSGEMYVVPKGVEHKPVARAECKILLIEPRGVVNTGTAGGVKTAPQDVWI